MTFGHEITMVPCNCVFCHKRLKASKYTIRKHLINCRPEYQYRVNGSSIIVKCIIASRSRVA